MIVILDSSVITLLVMESQPPKEAYLCKQWLLGILARGAYILAPEICIYEVRRGILYAARKKGRKNDIKLRNLENLNNYIDRLTLSAQVLYEAAWFWSTF